MRLLVLLLAFTLFVPMSGCVLPPGEEGDPGSQDSSLNVTDSGQTGPVGSIPQSSIISAYELFDLIQGTDEPFIVDTRRQVDFIVNNIRGSINIPLSQLDVGIRELPVDSIVVLVSENEDHAEKCWDYLVKNGWSTANVLVLYGGIDSWTDAGFETENITLDQLLC